MEKQLTIENQIYHIYIYIYDLYRKKKVVSAETLAKNLTHIQSDVSRQLIILSYTYPSLIRKL